MNFKTTSSWFCRIISPRSSSLYSIFDASVKSCVWCMISLMLSLTSHTRPPNSIVEFVKRVLFFTFRCWNCVLMNADVEF